MHPYLTGSLFLLVTLTVLGCEEELAPRDHFEAPFSMYGVLSPQLDTQSVRVYALEDVLTLRSSEPLDAVLTSTDLTTGDVQTWTQTVVAEPNGQYEYLFHAPFRAEYGHRYRIEIERQSDGAVSFAEVRIPSQVTVDVLDPDESRVQVRVTGEEDFRVLKSELEYVVKKIDTTVVDPAPPTLAYRLSYEGTEHRTEEGWLVDIKLRTDRDLVQQMYHAEAPGFLESASVCNQLVLRDLTFYALVGDSAWNPPGGIFNPDQLAQPGTMQNVQNGFGFIGAGYRIDKAVRPTERVVEDACFYYDFVF